MTKSTTTRANAALVADMANNPDDPLKWFIAIGNNNGWGRSAKSEAEAVANMNKNGHGKAKEYFVYKCTEKTTVNDMGGFTRPMGDPEPMKIAHVGGKKIAP